jgi:hypothetical protein
MTAQGEKQPLNYAWSIKTACACANGCSGGGGGGGGGGGDSSISAGSVLLIIGFVGLAVYFIVGTLVMRFRFQAAGVEMIPNVSFWKDLPALIKDGWNFTLSKTCRRGQYQSM